MPSIMGHHGWGRIRQCSALRALPGASGTWRLTLSVPSPATVGAALAVLAEAHPRIGLLIDNTMVAVNQEYADRAQVLEEGDEVALIPPVSGGGADVAHQPKRPKKA